MANKEMKTLTFGDVTYETVDEKARNDLKEKIPNSEKGKANGVASLDNNGKVPEEQLPELGEKYDVGGEKLGLVKNGGNVVINSDGTMIAPSYESEGENSFATNETNIGLGDYSFASGINTISGGKGFKVLSRTGKIGSSGSYTLDSIVGLEIGDQYSIRLQNNYDYNGVIKSISTDTNIITVTNYIDEEIDSSREVTLWIPEKPTIGTTKLGQGSHAEGYGTRALCYGSHAEGCNTKALAQYAHSEGRESIASGNQSHAEGNGTTASGNNSHAEGYNTTASSNQSHAEGYNTTASAYHSHAEGLSTTASGNQSHAEGYDTTASAHHSHAEGYGTTASGYSSHAEGADTIASASRSHAEGVSTKALGYASHVQGKYNVIDNGSTAYPNGKYAHIVGNGTSSTELSNAHTVSWEGQGYFAQGTTMTGADYAEFFEWLDGNPNKEDRVGLLVTLDGEKIRLANVDDEVLGIISGTAAVLGDNYECEWNGKYLTDDFGRVIYDLVEEFVDEIVGEDEEGNHIIEKQSLGFWKHPRINPDYDPEQKYINRTDRPEWDTVGMLGKLYVRDDRTCQVNGYATVGENGIATASSDKTNMRVLSRVNENVVRVLLK